VILPVITVAPVVACAFYHWNSLCGYYHHDLICADFLISFRWCGRFPDLCDFYLLLLPTVVTFTVIVVLPICITAVRFSAGRLLFWYCWLQCRCGCYYTIQVLLMTIVRLATLLLVNLLFIPVHWLLELRYDHWAIVDCYSICIIIRFLRTLLPVHYLLWEEFLLFWFVGDIPLLNELFYIPLMLFRYILEVDALMRFCCWSLVVDYGYSLALFTMEGLDDLSVVDHLPVLWCHILLTFGEWTWRLFSTLVMPTGYDRCVCYYSDCHTYLSLLWYCRFRPTGGVVVQPSVTPLPCRSAVTNPTGGIAGITAIPTVWVVWLPTIRPVAVLFDSYRRYSIWRCFRIVLRFIDQNLLP